MMMVKRRRRRMTVWVSVGVKETLIEASIKERASLKCREEGFEMV